MNLTGMSPASSRFDLKHQTVFQLQTGSDVVSGPERFPASTHDRDVLEQELVLTRTQGKAEQRKTGGGGMENSCVSG